MKFAFISAVFIFFTSIACGQQKSASEAPLRAEDCTVGFYTRETIALQLNGFKPWYDSIQQIQLRKQELQKQNFLATDRYLMAVPDSGTTPTPQQQNEYKSSKKETESLTAAILAMNQQITTLSIKHLQPYYDSIALIAVKLAKQMNMAPVFEISDNRPMNCPSDKMLMVDITNDIALAFGVKPNLIRIGTFNTDSLLRLMPGYAALADSTLAELTYLNKTLAAMDLEIQKLHSELDSLRPTLSKRKIKDREEIIAAKQELRDIHRGYESYKIDMEDSIRTVMYNRKLRAAAPIAAKELNCQKHYDNAAARSYWTAQEAEFIDLNSVIAEKLK